MTIFYYKAKKSNGQTTLGQVTAKNQDEAVDIINRLGLVPISVESKLDEITTTGVRHIKIKHQEVYLFTRQLSNLLKSGVSILRALDLIGGPLKNVYFKNVITLIGSGIRDGRSLSDCLADYPQIFSPLYINLVKVGEESGNLKEVFLNLSEYQRQQEEIRRGVRGALVYPAFMLVIGIITVIFILTFVLPKITVLFADVKTSLPLPTIILLSVTDFLKVGWYWLILGVIVLMVLMSQFKKSQIGSAFLSRFKLSLPFLGPFFLKLDLALWARTLELLLRGGIPILKAIQISVEVLNNHLIKEDLVRSHKDLTDGLSLGKSLKKSALIPALVSDLVAVGEETGSLTEIFHDITDIYEQEIQTMVRFLTTLMEPVMILGVGLVIGFIVFAMLLPIFQVDVFAH